VTVATVTAGPQTRVTGEHQALAAAIPRRHSSRAPFEPRPLAGSVLTALVTAALPEGGTLVVVDAISRHDVLGLVRAADTRQHGDQRYRLELADWTAPSAGRADGVPPSAFGPRPVPATLPLRDFAPDEAATRPVAAFEPNPTIAVLYGHGDTPRNWVQGGQALQRVLLTATVHGVLVTLLTQPVELPPLGALFSATHDTRVARAVLRFGYGQPGAATPRRPIGDVLLPG
jgi:hypothetical protein